MIYRKTIWQLFFSLALVLLFFTACQPAQDNVDPYNDSRITKTSTATLSSLLTKKKTPSPLITSPPTTSPTPDLPAGLSPLFNEDLAVIDLSNVTNLVELAVFGDGFLISIEISLDGTTAAVVFSTGVEIYDLQAVELLSVFYTNMKFNRSHMDYQLSPNGKYFALVKYDQVEIWQTDNGTQYHQIQLESAYKEPKIIFSPDNRSFSVIEEGIAYDKVLRLVSMETGGIIIEKEEIYKTSFSADGKYIAVIATNKGDRVDIFNTINGNVEHSINGPDGAVALAFSPSEDHLSVAYKNAIWVWDFQDNNLVNTLYGENSNIYHTNMMYTDDGQTMIVESEYNPTSIKLWDMTTGDLIMNLPDHRYPVLSSDKTRLVTFQSQTYQYYIWDLISKKSLAKIDQGHLQEQVIYYLPDGKHVNFYYHDFVFSDGLLPLAQYKLEDGSVTIEKRPDVLGSVDILFFPRYNLSAAADIIIAWPIDTLTFFYEVLPARIVTRNASDGSVMESIELTHQSAWYKYIEMKESGLWVNWDNHFIGNSNRFMREIAQSRHRGNDPIVSNYNTELISLDNFWVAVQTSNSELSLKYNGDVDELTRKSFLDYIKYFEFSIDSKKIYIVHNKHLQESVSVWDIYSEAVFPISTIDARFHTPDGGWRVCNNRPFSVSPDGKLIALSGENCTIRLVSAVDYNDEICVFSPSVGSDGIMAFSPSSELLATAFSGGEIQIWNSKNCELIHTLYDHVDPFSDETAIIFSFSPDGTILGIAYGGQDVGRFFGSDGGTISFWGINQ